MESILFLSPSRPTAYGSAYLAKQLKAAGVDVQGMFSNDSVF
jgi:hypothetical protein